MRTVAHLKKGEKGLINSFTDSELSLKLLDMGCLPGSEIELIRTAPLGDPIIISISGYLLSLRLDEASTILLTEN
jgi:ferrous iron transport protein A